MNLDRSFFAILCRNARVDFFPERSLADTTSRAETIADILTGQVEDVQRVIEFNPVEGTARDVSEDIAREIAGLLAEPVGRCDLRDFLEKNRPATKPGQFTTSGSMRTRRSVMVSTMIRDVKKSHLTVVCVIPNSR